MTLRELNRAFLARQALLARAATTPLAMIEQLVGVQAQVPRPPFVGLWTRLVEFARADLDRLIQTKRVVRGTLMRRTLHLMSQRDYLAFRPLLAPMLVTGIKTILGQRVDGLDMSRLTTLARTKLPATFDTLRGHLGAHHPDHDERALGYAVRLHLPLLMVPTKTKWSYPANAHFASADDYLGKPLGKGAPIATFVKRYLAAFGPASPKDMAAWSGMRDLAPAFAAMRDSLVTFESEGRELFDLPDAPRPGDVDAPVRYITEYDNLLLGHADRRRIIADAHRKTVSTTNGIVRSTYLVDGMVAGMWAITRAKAKATLTLQPFAPIPKAARAALEEEGDRLVRWVEDDATTFAFAIDRG